IGVPRQLRNGGGWRGDDRRRVLAGRRGQRRGDRADLGVVGIDDGWRRRGGGEGGEEGRDRRNGRAAPAGVLRLLDAGDRGRDGRGSDGRAGEGAAGGWRARGPLQGPTSGRRGTVTGAVLGETGGKTG